MSPDEPPCDAADALLAVSVDDGEGFLIPFEGLGGKFGPRLGGKLGPCLSDMMTEYRAVQGTLDVCGRRAMRQEELF